MVTYSAWTWSEEHRQHYVAVYDDSGRIIQYRWESGHVQEVAVQPPPASGTPQQGSSPNQSDTQSGHSGSYSTPSSYSATQQVNSLHNYPVSTDASKQPLQTVPQPSTYQSRAYRDLITYAGEVRRHTYDIDVEPPPPPPPLSTMQSSTQASLLATSWSDHNNSQFQHALPSQSSYPNSFHQQYGPSSLEYTNSTIPYPPSTPKYQSQTEQPSGYPTPESPYTSRRQAQGPQQSPPPAQPLQQYSPSLPQAVQESVGGDKKSRYITTVDPNTRHERLDKGFKRVSAKDHARFFVKGRVFKMLWVEPAGDVPLGQSRGSSHFSWTQFGEQAYSEIRRFVVIQNKGTFSQCIPIQSYRGQGATKKGLIVEDHAIIYTYANGAYQPRPFSGEALVKQPICVYPSNSQVLTPSSRINFGKPYAVEHNCKLFEIGIVADAHLHLLTTYFGQASGVT